MWYTVQRHVLAPTCLVRSFAREIAGNGDTFLSKTDLSLRHPSSCFSFFSGVLSLCAMSEKATRRVICAASFNSFGASLRSLESYEVESLSAESRFRTLARWILR